MRKSRVEGKEGRVASPSGEEKSNEVKRRSFTHDEGAIIDLIYIFVEFGEGEGKGAREDG